MPKAFIASITKSNTLFLLYKSPILLIIGVLGKMGCKPSDKPKPKPKLRHRKGLWSPEEDQRLGSYVFQHGHGCWSSVPINAGNFPPLIIHQFRALQTNMPFC